MHLVTGKPTWLCAKKSQHIDKKSISVSLYKGTLFEGSKASPQKIMHILYCWSLKLTFVQTRAQTGASPNTVDRWFTIFRKFCMEFRPVRTESHWHALKRRITRGGIKKGYLMEHFGEHIFMKDHSVDIIGAMLKEIVKQYVQGK